jgi:GT2 family glycosyltransferase
LFFDLGGYRRDYTGAQDYDFVLRAASANVCIVHVPRILYHWRMNEGSAAARVDAKPAALGAARRAVEDFVHRSGRPGHVLDGKLTGTHRVRYELIGDPRVTVVIPTDDRTAEVQDRGKINLVRNLVTSIRKITTYRNYEILVVDNARMSPRTAQFLRTTDVRLAHFKMTSPRFNFAQKANFCIENIRTELFIMLNDDMEIITPDWIEGLMEWAQLPEIGMVGARLLYPDKRIQHAGMVLGVNEAAAHVYHQFPADFIGYNGYPNLIRNYSALTAAALASRKSLFKAVGGFDERFSTDFNDVDFCLKLRKKGLRIVYTPFVSLYHFEGKTCVREAVDSNELVEFKRRWRPILDRDPYYNVNLSRDHVDFRLASQPRLSFD